MQLIGGGKRFVAERFKRWRAYSYCRNAFFVQTCQQVGKCFVEPAQLREGEESEFPSTHAFKGGKARAHTTGPCYPTMKPLSSRQKRCHACDEEGENIADRCR